jgi:VWFA-related protein
MLKQSARGMGVALLLLATAISAQTPAAPGDASERSQVTFKVEVNYVEVDARVVDARGEFIRTLKKEDFQLLEDGKVQAISTFALVDVPVVLPEKPLIAGQPDEPDVVSNARAFDGRLYIIVLDDLHTDALRSQRVRIAARRFIEQNLGANDLGAVVVTSGQSDAVQNLTGDRRLLLRAVDMFVGQKLRNATLEKIGLYNDGVSTGSIQPNDRISDPSSQERLFHSRRAIDSIRAVAEWLGGVRGRRKALVLFSEGIDYDVTDVFDSPGNQFNFEKADGDVIASSTRDAVAAATRSGVVIYAVDPRGLTAMGDELIELGSLADATPPPSDPGQPGQSSARSDLGLSSLYMQLQLSQDSLRALAEPTGGFAAVNSNDFTKAFERIQEENSSYYVMGYYPSNERRDGKFRKIDVRVTSPGLTVQARRGYIAPRTKPAPRAPSSSDSGSDPAIAGFRDLIENPLPVSGLTMDVSAVSFKGEGRNTSVTVVTTARGRDLTLTERDGKATGELNMFVGAFDKDGKVKASERPKVTLALRPETYRVLKEHGVRVISRLQLPPGRYELRVIGRESSSRLQGSVHHHLEVPDFGKEPFSLSGIVLASTADASSALGADRLLGGGLPAPPTTSREFPVGSELAVLAELYNNQASAHKIDITRSVLSSDGQLISREEGVIDAPRNSSYRYMTTVPLNGLRPGMYVLRISARARLAKGEELTRALSFRIRS